MIGHTVQAVRQTTAWWFFCCIPLLSPLAANAADTPYPSVDLQALREANQKTFWNPLSRRWLTQEQVQLLNRAYEIGVADGGHDHALLLQAMLMQESHAGNFGRIGDVNAPVGKRSYGVMQVKRGTAHDVLLAYPGLGRFHTEEALIIRLVTDDVFNIRVASKHLLMLRDKTNSDATAVMAYNIGLSKSRRYSKAPEKHRYVSGVRRYLGRLIWPFNHHYGNGVDQVVSSSWDR